MDPKQTPINYFYFGGIFLLLVFIAAENIFSKEYLGGSHFFFFLYAIGQCVLETALFISLGVFIRKYLGKICFALFIAATFIALILHLLDFMMNRILDLSIWETFQIFVMDESLDNFLYLLDATGVPLWGWALFFAVLALLPFLGILLYKMSEAPARRLPLFFRHAPFLQAFICIPCALFFWDFSASNVIHPDAYRTLIKSLPWKFTFLHPQTALISMKQPLRKPPNEQAVATAITQNQTIPAHRPNIYLFVVESLREDCITPNIAPHLHQFKQAYSHFDLALSNGNGSHLSWFSIFHSQFPYYWQCLQKKWGMGSPALNLLKQWGYQIHLYTSAQLAYYGMEDLLFGKQKQLLTSYQTFHHAPPTAAAETDAAALAKLQQDIAANPALQEGQIFIVFWDCTHFDYSWPKSWTPKFTPFAKEFAYFKAFHSQETINQIKNRYHNAVNYMDSLFGKFFDNLPRKEEAVVIVMGDHGEEFFEHGHLFHNSHLTHEQTHVPLYFKFGAGERPLIPRPVISQMDIFPSLLDYIGGQTVSFLEGNSLFRKAEWPYAVTARFNAGRTPYEFCINNGKHKLIAQFSNRASIFDARQLQILSLRSYDDKTIPECKGNVNCWVRDEFGPALHHLFELD